MYYLNVALSIRDHDPSFGQIVALGNGVRASLGSARCGELAVASRHRGLLAAAFSVSKSLVRCIQAKACCPKAFGAINSPRRALPRRRKNESARTREICRGRIHRQTSIAHGHAPSSRRNSNPTKAKSRCSIALAFAITRPPSPCLAPCALPSSQRLRSERPGFERRARRRADDEFSLLPG